MAPGCCHDHEGTLAGRERRVVLTVSKGLVLVIDDDPRIRKLLTIILNRSGYDVDVAPTGRIGLRQFVARRPVGVLLDLGLPDIESLDVLKRLRRASRVGIVIVTGRGEDEARIVCLQGGADDYVTKPFSARDLIARLSAVLERKAAPAAA
jgi:DNA-binding response OmpR family regulator